MKRYAAFLRGVMPTNCKMAELKQAFEKAGFAEVKTVLGSGNVVFSAAAATETALERKAEAAMEKHLGRAFFTIVRPIDTLQKMLATDPYARFKLAPGSKRGVTFFRSKPATVPKLPVVLGVDILDHHLELARTRYAPLAARLTFEHRSIYELGLPDRTFDLTVCRHVVHSIPHADRVYAELARVTKRGGRLHLIPEDYGMLQIERGPGD